MPASGPDPIQELIAALARLPGIGEKTAARLAFHILDQPEVYAQELARALVAVKARVRLCGECQDLTEDDPCRRCRDQSRDRTVVCVVARPQDLRAVDRTGAFRGRYHVLHGVLSPLDGVGPDQLRIKELLRRLEGGEVREVIVATGPSVEGEATALYLSRLIAPAGATVSRLAVGLPVGGDLEYADQATLGRALENRTPVGPGGGEGAGTTKR
ncbi:MAG TPA: recombination mediator RecR [Myxococcota bacterium]|jgi:recombination protein RecR|nr:recombination mediator RecR [Myxococcota bacterium]